MAQTSNNEIWMHVGHRTWKAYKNVNEDLRMELYRNGWTQVRQNETVEETNENKTTIKYLKKKNGQK